MGPREAAEEYFRDLERVRKEIWSDLVEAGPRIVLDVGVGDSTGELLKVPTLGYLIGVDCDDDKLLDMLKRLRDTRRGHVAELVAADALHLPLRDCSVDITVLSFVLHEVDPRLHLGIPRDVRRVSRRLFLVEPMPYGTRLYEELWHIWRDAMSAIGGFEEYRPPSYWLRLVEDAGFTVAGHRAVSWRSQVPYEVLESLVKGWADEWRMRGVPEDIVSRLLGFPERARRGESGGRMYWSLLLSGAKEAARQPRIHLAWRGVAEALEGARRRC